MGRDRLVSDDLREARRSAEPAIDRSRQDRILWRDHAYRLSASQRRTIHTLGTFRVVAITDLRRFVYGLNRSWLDADLKSLAAQRLVERHAVSDGRSPDALAVATLTRTGCSFGAHRIAEPGQPFHYGVTSPKDVRHDAALYRVYQAESARLDRRGARVRRVLLDSDLKRQLYSSGIRPAGDPSAPDAHQHALAAALGLPVVDGVVQVPDLRLEYQSAAGDPGRVDLELVTAHYAPAHLAARARAGFTIYAEASDAAAADRTLAERGVGVAVLSL